MKYFFVLGNHQALSLAEIQAIWAIKKWPFICNFLSNEVVVVESSASEQEVADLMARMGGVIKIGIVRGKMTSFNPENVSNELSGYFSKLTFSGKYHFGVSYYGPGQIPYKQIGMTIKTALKNSGASVRWVTSKIQQLSSVVVETNHLMDKGTEIVLLKFNNEHMWGQTLAVQPFKELSYRDYGRPARDDRSGMLPPKLAQIMLNLSHADNDKVVLDPFCGSGTVVTEAMLMGCQVVYGSDVSEKAVDDTEKNVAWIAEKFKTNSDVSIAHLSATELSEQLDNDSIDAIAAEPYLGPQRGKLDLDKIIAELNELYSQSLKELHKILRPNGRLVMVWPVWEKHIRVSPKLSGWKIEPIIKNIANPSISKQITNRQTIIYGRPEQKVWREVVVLTKSK